MKLNYIFPTGSANYAKLKHVFKGVEFLILVDEYINTEKEAQKCYAVFITPNGNLYNHEFYASKEFIEDVSELEFLEHVCEMVYSSFESKHGW